MIIAFTVVATVFYSVASFVCFVATEVSHLKGLSFAISDIAAGSLVKR
jgi:hypothetical protein